MPYTVSLMSSEYTGVVESWTWEAAWVDGKARGLVSQVSIRTMAGCMPAVLNLHVLCTACYWVGLDCFGHASCKACGALPDFSDCLVYRKNILRQCPCAE